VSLLQFPRKVFWNKSITATISSKGFLK
jgi:hypothetical protein